MRGPRPWALPSPEDVLTSQPTVVLVVDDEDDQAALLGTHLARAGCVVSRTDTAERALALPVDPAPDLVVVDLLLPGLDGWGLARALAVRWPGTRIAVSSVLDRREYPSGVLALPKPYTGRDVARLLAQLAEGPRAAAR